MGLRGGLSEEERKHFFVFSEQSVRFLRKRYNRANRWVVADLIRRSAYRYPDKTALVFRSPVLGEQTYTYRQLEELCNRFANALLDLGLERYDRVAILAHNTVHHVVTWFGTVKAGGIYVPINYMLLGKDIAYNINHSESKFFIVEDALYERVKDVLDKMPTVKTLVWSNQGAARPAPKGFVSFDELLAKQPPTEPDIDLYIEDPVMLTYTSGTETLPKGVVLTNQQLLANGMSVIVDGGYSPEDVNLNAMPLFHTAQRDGALTPIFWVGGTNVLLPQADPAEILRSIEKYRVTMFFAPPTVWIALLRHPEFDRHDLSSLKKGIYGASPMPVEVLKELLRRLPNVRFSNAYGQTELSPVNTILKPEDQLRKPGSAGRGILNMETALLDEQGNIVDRPGVLGEICGRGPHAMLMYFKDPEKTEEAYAHGWFHSGDIGVLDEDGYVTVVDRKKDMIKSGGENVSSREVEEVIYLDPRVSEVAVVGLPHPKWVEAVTAFVVPKKGQTIGAEELEALCRKHLAPFKVPKAFIFVSELPKSPSGKILKRDLRKEYAGFYGQ